MEIRRLQTMINHQTTEIFFDNLSVPAENLIGEKNKGFRYILDGLNAERILVAAEAIGDAYFFIRGLPRIRAAHRNVRTDAKRGRLL
jgi:acyl-CoA dehydrogenase